MNWFKGLFARVAKHKKHYWDFVKWTLILSCLMFGGVHLFMALIGSTGVYTFWMAFRIAVIMTGIDLIINIRVDNDVEERMAAIEYKAVQEQFEASRHVKIEPETI